MKISFNQPYFAPYAGFFYKMLKADIFVLLDQVQFPRGTTWLTRNRFKNDQGILLLTVPVFKKGLGFQTIDAVRICSDKRRERKRRLSLQAAYGHAPYFQRHWSVIEPLLHPETGRLIDLNIALIRYLTRELRIVTEVLLQSELGTTGRGDRLMVEICRRTGASTILVQPAARKHLNESALVDAGLRLESTPMPRWIYPQLWGPFIPNLSALDLIFNSGPEAGCILAGASPGIGSE